MTQILVWGLTGSGSGGFRSDRSVCLRLRTLTFDLWLHTELPLNHFAALCSLPVWQNGKNLPGTRGLGERLGGLGGLSSDWSFPLQDGFHCSLKDQSAAAPEAPPPGLPAQVLEAPPPSLLVAQQVSRNFDPDQNRKPLTAQHRNSRTSRTRRSSRTSTDPDPSQQNRFWSTLVSNSGSDCCGSALQTSNHSLPGL